MKGYKSLLSLIAVAAFLPLASASSAQAHGYLQHNLVSDTAAAGADHIDQVPFFSARTVLKSAKT
jgi:hypothetical protein